MKKRVFFLLLAALMPLAMNAQINASVHVDSTINACESYTWSVDGVTYTTSGIHTAVVGDTLYILDLTINPEYTITVPTPVQGGCTYTWGNNTYNSSGIYTQVFQSVAGCDSTVTITLVTATSATKEYTVTACESYIWKNDTLTTTGVTTITDNSNANCDSILTLNLTIINPDQRTYDTVISGCDRIRFRWAPQDSWKNITEDGYTLTSDDYSVSNSTARGIFHPRTVEKCFDSTVTVTFNVKTTDTTTVVDKGCNIYTSTVNDSVYIFTYTKKEVITGIKGANGCDSVIVLDITINPTPKVYITGDLRVTPGSNATLQANCDQQVDYRWSNGSTEETITLTNVQGNTDISLTGRNNTTECEMTSYATVMANVSVLDANDDMLQLYPNPTTAQVNINSSAALRNVSVFNLMGQQVLNGGNANVINLGSLANGTYVVRVEMQDGTVATRTVILTK